MRCDYSIYLRQKGLVIFDDSLGSWHKWGSGQSQTEGAAVVICDLLAHLPNAPVKGLVEALQQKKVHRKAANV